MNVLKRSGGLSAENLQRLEGELNSRGFVKVSDTSSISPRQYKITSYTGSAKDFGGERKYNVEWLE